MKNQELFLSAKNITKHYGTTRYLKKRAQVTKAVQNVSLDIYKGETLGLVGESGCGKSTLGKVLLRAIPATEGEVFLRSQAGEMENITAKSNKEMRSVRSRIQMIFQDPFNSLNPNMTVRDLISEPLLFTPQAGSIDLDETVTQLMEDTGLDSRYMSRYPHAFSGGQRQRICIARAIATSPEFIVCDEAVSALDVSIRAQIINLLMDLQQERGMTYLFISHDLSVVRHISDRVAVLYMGKLVELGTTEQVYEQTAHPYTQLLLDSAPVLDPTRRKRRIEPEVSEISEAPVPEEGCPFYPRCQYRMPHCQTEEPQRKSVGDGHEVACFLQQKVKEIQTKDKR